MEYASVVFGKMLELVLLSSWTGERSKNKEDILQEQGVQEAHSAQGYPIQEG